MKIETNANVSRRGFMQGAGAVGAALVVGLDAKGAIAAGRQLVVNPFVKILADDTVVVVAKHFEMGQGTTTGLATLVAEELDADWSKVRVEWAPAENRVYKNLLFGAQGTGGSTAIANSFDQYRRAGASARHLLIRAAASLWNVEAGDVLVENGVVIAKSGQRASFGKLIDRASRYGAKARPQLKDAKDYKLIGKVDLPRKDSVSKTDGTAQFSIDVRLPEMVTALVARSPKFGGTVKSFDATRARQVKGVRDVKQIPSGIVVYAANTWSAIKGRDALEIVWDFSKAETRSSGEILDEYRELLDKPGLTAASRGDPTKGLSDATKKISAEFVFPFLAHAPMEPLNCVIKYDAKGAEVWDGCQFPAIVQPTVAAILGLKPEQVKINTLYAGGSFGRRATPNADYAAEAAMAAKAIGGKWPVKLMWTREDDLRGGYYRPFYVHRLEAGIDAEGNPIAWRHRLAGKSILIGSPFESALVKDGLDSSSVEGAADLPYSVPNFAVDVRNTKTAVPVLWWRSVGHTHTAYAAEVAIDMLAEAAGKDPVAYRLALLKGHDRLRGVLKLAAEKANWGQRVEKGKGRGIAVHKSFNSYVAQVVDVSTDTSGAVKVDRVVCAVDCGLAVNPDVIKAQMEGGIGYGLGAVMRNQITLKDGLVEQENFPDYEPLRISDMPNIDVHIVPSNIKPTGVGEPGTPPIGPALANAIYQATGKRVLSLPMSENGVTFIDS